MSKTRTNFAVARKHRTGYEVTFYGETYWHRTLDGARRRVDRQTYCSQATITDCATGETVD